MLTFDQCNRDFPRLPKRLATATTLERIDNDTFGIRYHSTYVVKIHRDGTFTLDSGGWRTATTKKRINQYSPARVYQSKHEWYAVGRNSIPFFDGMKIPG